MNSPVERPAPSAQTKCTNPGIALALLLLTPLITPSCDASHRFRYTRRRNLWGGRCCFSDIATRQSTLPSPLYMIAFHSLLVSNVKRGLPTHSVADRLSGFPS